jgi:ABC-type bacteriocin/lantibiotic exporter with double-glycine peptidase domain
MDPARAQTQLRHDARDALRELAETAARAAEVPADGSEVDHAVDAALRRHGTPRNDAWPHLLDDVARGLKLNVRWRTANEAEVADEVHAGLPAAAWEDDGWTLLVRRGARLERRRFPGGPKPEVVRAPRAGTRQPWALVEPTLPAGSLGDAHDHHIPPLQRLRGLLRAESSDLWAVTVYALAAALLSLAVPVAVQVLVNTVAFGAFRQPLMFLAIVLFAFLGVAAALRIVQRVVVEMLQRRLFLRLTADLAARVPRARPEAFAHATGAQLINRFFDVVAMQKALGTLLLEGIGAVFQAAVGMMLLAVYHPALLVYDLLLLAVIVLILWGGFQRAQQTAIRESRAKYDVADWLEEIAAQPVLFKLGGGNALAVERADLLGRAWLDARMAHFKAYFRQYSAILAVQAIAMTLLLTVGGWLVLERQLTLGQLVAAEIVVASILVAFTKVAEKLDSAYDLLAATEKIGHLVDLPIERAHGWAPASHPESIALVADHVTYTYPHVELDAHGHHTPDPGTHHEPVLHDLSFVVGRGERMLVVGGSGSGRSTLAEILLGMREPTHGRILVDEADLRELRLDALRRRVELVRNADIVTGTVLENVVFGRLGLGPEEVHAVLRKVGLEDVVAGLPQGLNTRLVPSEHPLTEVQRIRLEFARALIGEPALLVVDGALDGLEPDDAKSLIDALTASDSAFTLIVLSRTMIGASRMDRVLRLEHGTLRPLPRPA